MYIRILLCYIYIIYIFIYIYIYIYYTIHIESDIVVQVSSTFFRMEYKQHVSLCWMAFIIQVPLYINYYSVSLGWSLYTGPTVHQLLQCVSWVVFIYRFHCTLTTTECPLGGLYIQAPLYINYYSVSLGWTLYTGPTVHQLLQCVPWVVFIYRSHCTSTTTVCPLGGLHIQVPLFINY